ncbi:hypothetical protein EJ05DRAFT_537645 [Pseudovirgaria hyperparasitica]|uniref:Uncharacterized protein n=1 Tax=Pseudovirgaria hyperparasitica TaxID=470096 RepID=A0A6A6WB04_9PEZI|nr:uncharacterized protein EJ05DRAFT_537645 [Pseudovirgaria hyperparasitica]KAF2759359.1 hypothetical protein EJ05DRAFT_537645 [Pseudovirgaria hyperparasitica]
MPRYLAAMTCHLFVYCSQATLSETSQTKWNEAHSSAARGALQLIMMMAMIPSPVVSWSSPSPAKMRLVGNEHDPRARSSSSPMPVQRLLKVVHVPYAHVRCTPFCLPSEGDKDAIMRIIRNHSSQETFSLPLLCIGQAGANGGRVDRCIGVGGLGPRVDGPTAAMPSALV